MPLSKPMRWRRRIGGRSGITTLLPEGCYSDDSQLRLATSRAIGPRGFDVEAFAKVELPVWLSYALGGGKSTTAAAEHLAKTRSSWFANTFKGWTQSGGNGAAMRVQPHVWVTPTPDDPDSFLPDVLRNAICTHSHPTGLMGAVLHALCVAGAISTGNCPSPTDLDIAIDVAERLPQIMSADTELKYWRSAFELESGNFIDAWNEELLKTRAAARVVGMITTNTTAEGRYNNIVNGLRLREAQRLGNGMLTAVAATALTWCENHPAEATRIAANAVGTDTDTIATMAGAILGAASETDPPVDVLDADLFRSEADRLAKVSVGGTPADHVYPDLLHWSAPLGRADVLVSTKDGGWKVKGLGNVSKILGEPITTANGDFQWQWIQLEYGQTLLIKRREHVPLDISTGTEERRAAAAGRRIVSGSQKEGASSPKMSPRTPESVTVDTPRNSRARSPGLEHSRSINVRASLSYAQNHAGSDEQIGRILRQVVREGTPGQIFEFVSKLIDIVREIDPASKIDGDS